MITKAAFQGLKAIAAILAVSECLWCMPLAAALLPDNVVLERQCNVDLFTLDPAVGSDLPQEYPCLFGYGYPLESRTKGLFGMSGVIYSADAVMLYKSVERSPVNPGYRDRKLVADLDAASGAFYLPNLNASLTIEETREVGVIYHRGSDQTLANSVKLRCPARKGAEGQPRTKQEAIEPPGVRNEQVPAPKGKVCSALHGNMQKAAETTVSRYGVYHTGVTDSYNTSLLKTVRYVDPGHLKTGEYSFNGLQYKGLVWYWDRQCPTGRMYFLNRSAVHFYVDPQMMFTWTEPRAWPNQLVKTRLLSLRCALVYKRRMYLGVIDGITA